MLKFIATNTENGITLEKYIKKSLPDIPLSLIYKTFRKKDIKVNGHWEKEKYIVKTDDVIEVYISDNQIETYSERKSLEANDFIKDWIVFEDQNVLILNKPQGYLVQQDASKEKAVDEMVLEFLMYKGEYDPNKDKVSKPGPAHRLDRNTSGLLIFGKNRESLVELNALFNEHTNIEKRYLSLVCGNVTEDGEVDAPLRKNFSQNKVVVCPEKDGGKKAITQYKVIERFKNYTLLELNLITGRTHQIRVHMSYIRHHVLGDSKYGDFKANNIAKSQYELKTQFLHAYKFTFKTIKGKLSYLSNKTFKAELPKQENEILNKLRNE